MKNIYKLATVSLFGLMATGAHAAGYQLNEYSVTGLGRSFAGIGVVGDDYSALAYNPAGMTLVERSGVQMGVVATQVRSKALGEGRYQGQKTDMDFVIPLPSMFGQYNVNDKLFLGAGVYVPFGLATRYKYDSFVGQNRTGVRKSELEVIDFNLSAAYKLNSAWSLGASAIFRRITGGLTSNLHADTQYGSADAYSDFRVKGYTGTFNIGAMYEFNENARVGLSYRHKSIQKTSGKHYVTAENALGAMVFGNGKYHSAADPELPASIILSGYFKTAEQWATTATFKYTLWHRFPVFPGKTTDKTLLTNTGKKNLDVEYRWKDAFNIALGEEYYLNDNWTIRFGTAYDQSPSRSNTYRTNRIPDTDRIWASIGASYQKDNYQIDFGYAHLFFMHGSTRNSPSGDADAKYHSYSNMVGLNFQYKF